MRRAIAIVVTLAWIGVWVGCTVSPSGPNHASDNDNTNPDYSPYWGADAACYGSGPPGGEFGATQGGVQDMSLARELVAQGMVPPPEAFVVEAMFSEHDLPVDGPPCQTTLCLRAAMGIAPDVEGDAMAWVQVGMSSTIDPTAFQRPSLTVVASVDVSGSMGWGYPNGNSAGAITRVLLADIAAQLGAADVFAMVTFGSTVYSVLGLTPGDNQATIQQAINALHENGSTNIEAGLETAYTLAETAVGTTDEVRVMLFTDLQPNVGANQPSQFEQMVITGAADGVSITVFGLGLGLGAEFMTAMSYIRGANAFSLMAPDEVTAFMEDNWPWFTCPLAYDLSLKVLPAGGFSLTNSYGFPDADADQGVELAVATVFLSKRRGALLLQLEPPQAADPIDAAEAEVTLDYRGLDGQVFGETLNAAYAGEIQDERGQYMPQLGVAKAVALALLVSTMHTAAEAYQTDHAQAVAMLEPAVARFAADATAIGDPALDAEVAFAEALLQLMVDGAPQGNFYP